MANRTPKERCATCTSVRPVIETDTIQIVSPGHPVMTRVEYTPKLICQLISTTKPIDGRQGEIVKKSDSCAAWTPRFVRPRRVR